ncbi:uncharacterized protein [Henckelia pumila]|uniref:uncharacterized protein isoform X1 n=1 Tax=Henckelia pumila TaxID=405737 RepID=UPI003C6E8996
MLSTGYESYLVTTLAMPLKKRFLSCFVWKSTIGQSDASGWTIYCAETFTYSSCISKHHEIMDSMRIFSKNALTYRGQPFYHTSKDEVYPATTNDGKLPIFRVIIVQQNTRNKILPKIQIHISGAVIGNGQNICSFQGTKPWNL